MIPRRSLGAAGIALLASHAAPAHAQSFPNAPIRFIVPFTGGGPADIIARILAERASAELGVPVVVENRVGGNFVVGTQAAARARPDGYTMMIVTGANLIVSLTQENLPYNLERDLAPIMGIGSFPVVVAVPGGSSIRSLADLAALARTTNGGLTYGSGGVGSIAHLSAVSLLADLAVTGTHVPYRGSNEATQALVSNQVQLFMPSTAEVFPFLSNGSVRAIGVTTPRRLASLSDVPTTAELGHPRLDGRIWYGFLAPTGTPAAAVTRLREAFTRAIEHPAVSQRLAGMQFNAEIQSADEFARFMQSEAARWGGVIRDNHVRLNG